METTNCQIGWTKYNEIDPTAVDELACLIYSDDDDGYFDKIAELEQKISLRDARKCLGGSVYFVYAKVA